MSRLEELRERLERANTALQDASRDYVAEVTRQDAIEAARCARTYADAVEAHGIMSPEAIDAWKALEDERIDAHRNAGMARWGRA